MNKILTVVLTLTIIITSAFLTACTKEPLVIKESDTYVVIKVETDKTDLTLASYMASLEEYKDMFVIKNGMVESINGIENAADWSACWMIYTDDYREEFSNSAWGTIVYKDKTYNSAAFGAEKLIVKNDCTYIFVYQSF